MTKKMNLKKIKSHYALAIFVIAFFVLLISARLVFAKVLYIGEQIDDRINMRGYVEMLYEDASTDPNIANYPLKIYNNAWYGNQITGLEIWNGRNKVVPTSRIISQMNGSGNGGENLYFQTQSPSAVNPNPNQPTTKFTITASGDVGINTTNPSRRLHVNGEAQFNQLAWGSTPGASQEDALATVGYVNAAVVVPGDPGPTLPTGISGQTLRHDGAGWLANSNLFNNGTNVGIGNTAPQAKLDISGGLNLTDRIYSFNGTTRTFQNVASYYGGNTPSSGTIVVIIANPPNIMLDAEIDIQGYGGLTKCNIRGYTYMGSANWHQPAATCLSSGHAGGYSVRFGIRTSDNARVILIGNTSSSWGSYPHVTIPRVTYGYPGTGSSIGDWSIAITTDESAYSLLTDVVENSGFEAYRPRFGGNVGINVASPTETLHVLGGARFTGIAYGSTPGSSQTDALATVGYVNAAVVPGDPGPTLPTGISGQTLRHDGAGWLANSNLFNDGTNVGVGLTNPQSKLDVSGAIRTNNQLISTVANGTAPLVVSSATQVNNLNADLLDGQQGSYYDQRAYSSINNYLGGGYISGGLEKPNWAGFGAGKLKLQMLNGSNIGGPSGWNDVLWLSSYNGSDVKGSNALIFAKTTDRIGFVRQNYDATNWGTYREIYHTGNSNLLTVDWQAKDLRVNGSVGIGTVINPVRKLHVAGGSAQFDYIAYGATPGSSQTDALATVGYVNAAVVPGDPGPTLPTGISGQTLRHDGSGWLSTSNLFNNGTNVGIGTTAPNTTLAIKSSASNQLSLTIGDADYNLNFGRGAVGGGAYIYNNAKAGSFLYEALGTSASGIAFRSDGAIDFLADTGLTIGDSIWPDVRLKIAANGNVGIGKEYPGTKLDVNGSLRATSATITGIGGNGNSFVMADNSGNLYTQAGIIFKRTSAPDANYTALISDYIIAFGTLNANRTLTLPSPCTAGRAHIIVNETSGPHSVVVDPAGTATISGMASISLPAYNSIPVYCNGSDWFIY